MIRTRVFPYLYSPKVFVKNEDNVDDVIVDNEEGIEGLSVGVEDDAADDVNVASAYKNSVPEHWCASNVRVDLIWPINHKRSRTEDLPL